MHRGNNDLSLPVVLSKKQGNCTFFSRSAHFLGRFEKIAPLVGNAVQIRIPPLSSTLYNFGGKDMKPQLL
jgi:hypothetical protein